MTPEERMVEALDRAVILLGAAARFIHQHPIKEYTVFYDEAVCDGLCLANDCRDALNEGIDALTQYKEGQ